MKNLNSADREALEAIVSELAQAWNAGDAGRFAAPFARDAEQVNIFGMPLIGREEIRERHDRIFKTVFCESRNVLQIVAARYAAPEVIVARMSSAVDVPQGPLKGELRTLGSLVLRKTNDRWEILLFHNTRVTTSES